MLVQEVVREFSQQLFEPICEETKKLFNPVQLHGRDRLRLSLTPDKRDFLATIYMLRETGEEATASWPARGTWLHRLPEKTRLAGLYDTWKFAGTDFTALIINAIWPTGQLVIDDEAKLMYEFLIARFLRQAHHTADLARFKLRGESAKFNLIDHSTYPLAAYQRTGLLSSYNEEGFGLFMEQGTGKTPIVISRICNEAANMTEDRMYRALIVCPKNVRANWRHEFERFATVPGKVVVMRGSKLDRIKAMVEATQAEDDCKWTAVICSYEAILRTWDVFRMITWDLGVLDESHYIKSTYTKRFKKMMELRELCSSRMALTGTPITNTMFDLFAQFEWLGEGLSGFRNFKLFKAFYGRFADMGNTQFQKLVGYKNVPLIRERLARLSFIITKEEALPNLPKKLNDIIEVEMTKEQIEVYKQLRDEMAVEVEDMLADETRDRMITVNNVLTKLLRLAHITSGFTTYDAICDDEGEELEPKKIVSFDPNPKLNALMELLKEANENSKTIVWACWVHDLKAIENACAVAGIKAVTYYGGTADADRDAAEVAFNKGDARVFIGNPQAGGTGLNLLGYDRDNPEDKNNCDHVIYYSQNWSPTARAQSEDRAHRRGTRVPVRYTDLCVPGSIDEEIRTRVTQKRINAYELQDIRSILKAVLESLPDSGD